MEHLSGRLRQEGHKLDTSPGNTRVPDHIFNMGDLVQKNSLPQLIRLRREDITSAMPWSVPLPDGFHARSGQAGDRHHKLLLAACGLPAKYKGS